MLRFMTTTVFAFPHLEHLHAGDRAVGSSCAAGFTMSFAPITIATSVSRTRGDLVHLEHDVVRAPWPPQEHVHVSRHAARDRMDAEAHVDAALGGSAFVISYTCLRLRHRHAVAGTMITFFAVRRSSAVSAALIGCTSPAGSRA